MNIVLHTEDNYKSVVHSDPKRVSRLDIDEFGAYVENIYSNHLQYKKEENTFCQSVHIGIRNEEKKYTSFVFSVMFHPSKGFTHSYLMKTECIEYVDNFEGEDEDEPKVERHDWEVPISLENVWFPTFRQLVDFLKADCQFPTLVYEDTFIDHVDKALSIKK